MRAISADLEAILSGSARRAKVRIQVKDSGGTYRNLATYAQARSLIKSISWGETVDDPGIKWSAEIVRDMELLSVAPLMQTSGLNRGFDISASYAPLLQVGRQMKVEWALQAEDDPAAPSWNLAFTGYIDEVDWAGNTAQISGRGDEAQLVNCYIERERVYAYAQGGNADRGCQIFEGSRTHAVGDRVLPTNAASNGHFYRVTSITTGITAAAEPAWPTGGSSTVTSDGVTFTESGTVSDSAGTPVETILQQLLDDNLGSGAVTLWCPVSPSWNVKWFLVSRQPLFTELRALADQIGWCLRPMFDSASGTMKLKLYDPNRSSTTSLRTFVIHAIEKIKTAKIQIFDIRNVVRIIYSDSQDLGASGTAKRKVVEVSDATSIAKYGRLFCEIAEASSSNIDTSIEATTLANAVLSDLKEPAAEFSAEVPLFPFVELPDLFTLAANGVHFDVDEKLACIAYQHMHSSAQSNTSITVRGTPSSGKSTWLQRQTDAEDGQAHAWQSLDTTQIWTLNQFGSPVGGASGDITWRGGKGDHEISFEKHVSATSGFTPDSSTLRGVSSGRDFNFEDLDPNQVYYGVYIPLTFNGRRIIRGQPSAQITINPGFLQHIHLNPETIKMPVPPNGGFEGWFRGTSFPPDQWAMVTGTWGREIIRASSTNARSGQYGLLFTTNTTTAPKLRSLFFPAIAGCRYALSAWVLKGAGGDGTNNIDLAVEWYDASKTLITTSSFTTATGALGANWTNLTMGFLAPSGTQYAKVYIAKTTAVNFTLYVDDISLTGGAEAPRLVGATDQPAFLNSWVAFGGVYAPPRFYKDELGYVVLEGLAKSGSPASSVIFILPVGYRPATNENLYVMTVANDLFAVIEVQSNGNVLPQVINSSVHCGLWGIRFRPAN